MQETRLWLHLVFRSCNLVRSPLATGQDCVPGLQEKAEPCHSLLLDSQVRREDVTVLDTGGLCHWALQNSAGRVWGRESRALQPRRGHSLLGNRSPKLLLIPLYVLVLRARRREDWSLGRLRMQDWGLKHKKFVNRNSIKKTIIMIFLNKTAAQFRATCFFQTKIGNARF